MNRDILAGKWNQIRGEIQRRWGKLTDDDLDQIKGNYNKLAGRIQELYGERRDQIEKEIDALCEVDSAAAKDRNRREMGQGY